MMMMTLWKMGIMFWGFDAILKPINSQSLEDTQVKYILQKYT